MNETTVYTSKTYYVSQSCNDNKTMTNNSLVQKMSSQWIITKKTQPVILS